MISSGRPEVRARRGLVASPHTLASEAGLAIIRQGGNAVDAAIAAAITLAVVDPHMNSIGGDSFWLIYDARTATLRVLNAAGRSAAAVDAEGYRARYGTAPPTRGGAAALTVPGAVSGSWEAHVASREQMRSTIPWKALFEDAIAHARSGYSVSAGQRRVTSQAAPLFASDAADDIKRSFWPIYHPDRLAAGRFVQAELAATLRPKPPSSPGCSIAAWLRRRPWRRRGGSTVGRDLMGHAKVIRLNEDGLTAVPTRALRVSRWAASRYRGEAALVWEIRGSLLDTMAAPARRARSAPRHTKVATKVQRCVMPRQREQRVCPASST